ncbi:hypothetical protein F5148DRAFT_75550 [Russula earlei]|uniref:Uncharacterized protein n=1 Tax=Russula earlei TaxID=71964 RepID=A0ACC0U9J0_9AGAM|nr:hypothetical protein F5148DRAFT_75550 [Russula earlei]
MDTPTCSIPDDEPSKTVFDYPDADIILRSCDLQEFRVLKLYIINSSPILSKRIQAMSQPSHTAISNGGESPLPVLQLPDNGAILSSLLTFVFPVAPVLPHGLEETMQLLSVAQKYGMSSALTHVRGSIALRDPLIRPDNALRAYSLAYKYGLHREAVQAARVTLKSALTIENLEGKLDVMPGDHLYELWRYHQSVQAYLTSNIDAFTQSSARDTLMGLRCLRGVHGFGLPTWIDDYMRLMAQDPSFFDPIKFQIALAGHVSAAGNSSGGWGCSCKSLPGETIETFWTAVTAFVEENMKMAEAFFSIPSPREPPIFDDCIGEPTALPPLPENLDVSDPNIVIQSSDLVSFRVHKSILVSSSQFFRDMFSLPQPSNSEFIDGLPVVRFSEDAELIRALITVLYPISPEIPRSYERVLALLAAAQKYNMPVVQSSIRAEVARRALLTPPYARPFRAFAIAFSDRLSPEMETAARLTLDYPLTFETLEDDLPFFQGSALRELASFRKRCQDNIVLCLESLLDASSGPSKIWVGCHPKKSPKGIVEPTLPSWLRDFFTLEIEAKQYFTYALIKPSSIRRKYLEALRRHSPRSDACLSCLTVHAHEGERYCVTLEQNLSDARNQPLEFV